MRAPPSVRIASMAPKAADKTRAKPPPPTAEKNLPETEVPQAPLVLEVDGRALKAGWVLCAAM